jgi:hypothetical protein
VFSQPAVETTIARLGSNSKAGASNE